MSEITNIAGRAADVRNTLEHRMRMLKEMDGMLARDQKENRYVLGWDNGLYFTGRRAGGVEQAIQYTEAQATAWAEYVRNGGGEQAKPELLGDALAFSIKGTEVALEYWNKHGYE